MVFFAGRRWFLITLLLLSLVFLGFSGCFLDPLKSEGLPCSRKGECSSGLKCYLVPGYGSFCLSKGGSFEPFIYRDAGMQTESSPKKTTEPTIPEQKEQAREMKAEKIVKESSSAESK